MKWAGTQEGCLWERSHVSETWHDRVTEDGPAQPFLTSAPLRRSNRPCWRSLPTNSRVTGAWGNARKVHFTWGRLALSNQEGALRVPRSEEESHGFASRNVLEEPPAAQNTQYASCFELTTSLPSGARHALREMVLRLSNIIIFPVRQRTVQSPPWSLQQSCTGWSPAGRWWETPPNTTLDRPWMSEETATNTVSERTFTEAAMTSELHEWSI